MKEDRELQNSFLNTFNNSLCLLTEGAILDRLKREFCISLDNELVHAGLIYEEKDREILSLIYKQYIDIANSNNIPMMIMTPTIIK